MFDGEYRRSMENSSVVDIVRHSPADIKKFMRGPGFDGLDMSATGASRLRPPMLRSRSRSSFQLTLT